MAGKIIRVTMFKLPSKENQQKMIGLYKVLSETARKDGKPYILSLEAGPAYEDARSNGFTFVAKSEFSNLDDMKYYDTDCTAHSTLKNNVKDLGIEGIMTTYYSPGVSAGL
ncbi:hypothetical protein OIDMADRAFT_19345 [Oidiodendron maius Zn]|uniref:Stress-response A/B barrel domain-containing protein n=1 Tax=Oidiodendron maius (strain Zn) TaxID=913774 RepID=A0A0C3HGP8_OIDMZ|nr:hypothetical protein OIDMADRAFT_19345 [Oidiodendron maius Zn]